jgi:ABC-type branched-subunit amino acid transport system substrate-binding protein
MGLLKTRRARALCGAFVVALALSACGNAGDDSSSSDSSPGATVTTFKGTDFNEKQKVDVQGVSDTEIKVAAITSKTNPLGGDYGLLDEGIKAYFDLVNSKGGIWGRQLKLAYERDDQTGNNTTQVEASLAQDKPYAMFIAVQLFTGAPKLAAAGIPTFGWNINAEWAGPKNFFPNTAPNCFGCKAGGLPHVNPWLAQQVKAHKVAVLGYNVPQAADCVTGAKNAFEMFGDDVDAHVVFTDNSFPFGTTDFSPQVSQMKAKGVDFLTTCVDFNGDVAIAKEMKKQGILDKVTFVHANIYNPDFVKANAQYLEGGILGLQIAGVEHKPAPAAVQEYLDYATKNNLKVTEMTMHGWIAARQFVDALKAAGPNFTWSNLVNGFNQTKWYTNGGWGPPIDWTIQHDDPAKNPAALSKFECSSFVKIENGKFVGVYDDGGAKPWVCFDGTKRDTWTDPVNVSFDTDKPFTFADVQK